MRTVRTSQLRIAFGIEKFHHLPYSLGSEAGVNVTRDFFDETIHSCKD